MAHYTIEGWNNSGLIRITEPLPRKRALALAEQLSEEGFTHIMLTDVDTRAQLDLATFRQDVDAPSL